jgi:hypothetical protein
MALANIPAERHSTAHFSREARERREREKTALVDSAPTVREHTGLPIIECAKCDQQ